MTSPMPTLMFEAMANRVVGWGGGIPGTLRITDVEIVHTPWVSSHGGLSISTQDVVALASCRVGWLQRGLKLSTSDGSNARFCLSARVECEATLRRVCHNLASH